MFVVCGVDERVLIVLLFVDAAGGMGRHLGVFSCTMLMSVSPLSLLAPIQ